MGTSTYCHEGDDESLESSSSDNLTLVIHHLLFVEKFGNVESEGEWIGERFYTSHRGEFQSWVADGAPGLKGCELEEYLSKHPIG